MINQLIYVSQPFGFDDLALSGILATSRANNARDGITGALICREDIYLQLLEGEAGAINQTFTRIQNDDRHTEIHKLLASETEHRLFPNWAMRHDPARSLIWTPEMVRSGAPKNASPRDVLGIFAKLSKQPPVASAL